MVEARPGWGRAQGSTGAGQVGLLWAFVWGVEGVLPDGRSFHLGLTVTFGVDSYIRGLTVMNSR
jgi:hypothetical protein